MDGTQYTSNTPGSMYGITSTGAYSPRLDILQQEMASGKYTTVDDAAALGREIARVYSGQSGDMLATGADALAQGQSTISKGQAILSGIWGQMTGGPAGAVSGVANSVASQASSGSWTDRAIAWWKEHAMSALLIVIGIICLVGAFFTYKE